MKNKEKILLQNPVIVLCRRIGGYLAIPLTKCCTTGISEGGDKLFWAMME